MDEILAPMLVGGFTSVSLASVLIASTLVGRLVGAQSARACRVGA